jgi:hypothetical protein
MKSAATAGERSVRQAFAGPGGFARIRLTPVGMALVGSVLSWCILLAAFPPIDQNFPLNDDWAFARGALAFYQGRGIDYHHWASMPQLGQWLWSIPFLVVLGSSPFALRISTIVLGWVGLWAFGDLLRQEGVAPRRAALLTAALGLNPLFFLLQGTFMTDVPALAFSLAALALYQRAIRTQSLGWLAAAVVAALLAVGTRQNTVVLCLVAGIQVWRTPHLRCRLLWIGSALLPLAAGVAVHFWFQARPDVRTLSPGVPSLPNLLLLPFLIVHFCGLAVLPALALGRWRWRRFTIALVVLLGCAIAWGYVEKIHQDVSDPRSAVHYLPYPTSQKEGGGWGLFPYSENMLTPWGAFAGSAGSGSFVLGFRPVVLGVGLRLFLSLLGCIGGAAFMARINPSATFRSPVSPLVLFTLFQIPVLFAVPDFYDRYLIFLLPGVLAFAEAPGQPDTEPRITWQWAPGLAMLVLFGAVSVGLMHDWLAWNSARWKLGERALSVGIPSQEIEGGVEWNGWYSEPDASSAQVCGYVLPFTRDWFGNVTGRYGVSFSAFPGTVVVDEEPYTLWLVPGDHRFYLVEFPSRRRSGEVGRAPVDARRRPSTAENRN